MTNREPDHGHDHGRDHDAHDAHDDAHDETAVHEHEHERVVERPAATPVAAAAPYEPVGSQVNVNSSAPGYVTTAPGPLYYARRVVSLLFGIVATLIGLRILLLLFVANQQNAIVDFVYTVTEPFVAPFRGIFALDQVSPGGASVFDIAALVALIGWLLIYLLIMAILRIGDRTAPAV